MTTCYNVKGHRLSPSTLKRWILTEGVKQPRGGGKRKVPLGLLTDIKLLILGRLDTGECVQSTMLVSLIRGLIEESPYSSILDTNGGEFLCCESYVIKLCQSMNLTYRRATTATQKLPLTWEKIERRFHLQIAYLAWHYKIPPGLIINADQTGHSIVPVGKRSYRMLGVKSVAIMGADEKRQITLLPSVACNGKVLPMLIIFLGKTFRSLPSTKDMKELTDQGCQFLYTDTHWSTNLTMKKFVNVIVVPFLLKRVSELKLLPGQKCLLLLDVWKVHLTEDFRGHIRENYNWILVKYIPAGCTSKF
jgi:hypothetical protein